MKVSELINQLKKYSQDLPVVLEPDIYNVESLTPCELAEEIVNKREKGLTFVVADATEIDKEGEEYDFIVPKDLGDEAYVLHRHSNKRTCLIISSEYFEIYDGGIGE